MHWTSSFGPKTQFQDSKPHSSSTILNLSPHVHFCNPKPQSTSTATTRQKHNNKCIKSTNTPNTPNAQWMEETFKYNQFQMHKCTKCTQGILIKQLLNLRKHSRNPTSTDLMYSITQCTWAHLLPTPNIANARWMEEKCKHNQWQMLKCHKCKECKIYKVNKFRNATFMSSNDNLREIQSYQHCKFIKRV